MPELDLRQSLSDIAYSAGVASHPHRPTEIRRIGMRRRRRRTALVTAGSAVVVAATAVGAVAISPIGDDSTQPIAPPSTDSPSVPTPSETTPSETPLPSPAPAPTGAADAPFLLDSDIDAQYGDLDPGRFFDEPELECSLHGIDPRQAVDVGLTVWTTESAAVTVREYVFEFPGTAEADAAVGMTGAPWELCSPGAEPGQEVVGPLAVKGPEEAFHYAIATPETGEVLGSYDEVAIARHGSVALALVLTSGDTPDASLTLIPDWLLVRAVAEATDTVGEGRVAVGPSPAEFLPDREIQRVFGAGLSSGSYSGTPEGDPCWAGVNLANAAGRQPIQTEWNEKGDDPTLQVKQVVMSYASATEANAAVAMTGSPWDLCAPSGGTDSSLFGPEALAIADEGFRYAWGTQPHVPGNYYEAVVARRGPVVVVLDYWSVGTVPEGLAGVIPDELVNVALDRAAQAAN